MKKVLICMLQLHKNSGSARTAMENIHYFKTRGFEVHVAAMTIDMDSIKAEGAIPHKLLPWVKSTGMFRRKWFNWQIERLKSILQPQITVGHGDIQNQDVLTLHNSVFLASELIHGKALDPKNEMARTHGPILRANTFKKMIANSKIMKADTEQRFGIDPKKIEVVYPALDTKTFHPDFAKKSELRKRFGFGDKVVVALVTSGNFKKRGLDIFNEAVTKLPEAIRDQADFRIIGKDKPNVTLHSSIKMDPSLNDIVNYYRAIDVFVLPARIEEFGRVVLEAMGCGLPVVTTDKVGAGELLVGESEQFIIPSHNVDALVKALTILITDANLRTKLGILNAETALLYSEERVYAKFDQVFGDLLNKA